MTLEEHQVKEKSKIKVEWELIEQDHAGYLYRAKVPGGYLWRHCDVVPIMLEHGQIDWNTAWHNSITFQPDEPLL